MTEIVDAHLHFWDPHARHHDWLTAHPSLQQRFGPDDLDTGGHELIGAVFVQADCREDEALDEVGWVERLAEAYPFVSGIVAYAPLHRGRTAERQVARLAARPLVVGVRRLLQGQPTEAITASAFVRGVRMLSDWGLTFDLCVTHDQLPAAIELVRACPRTVFVLDHLGKPPVASGQAGPWRDDLRRLATYPNVACKLSGLSTEAAQGWRPSDIRPYLEYGLEVFGPERCMVGSDWPVATLGTTVERWFDLVLDVIAELSADDQAAVLWRTATTTYDLVRPERYVEGEDDARRAVRR
jgi:predicted TIM-barrel fold metal-dependent hydrolase